MCKFILVWQPTVCPSRSPPSCPRLLALDFNALVVNLEEASYLGDVVRNQDVLPLSFQIAESFQRLFFNWHSVNFFPFHEHLFPAEIDYIDTFFTLYGNGASSVWGGVS